MGPALSCFDADLSAASRPGAMPKSTAEAKRMAQQHTTAQEARSMIGAAPVHLQRISPGCAACHQGPLSSLEALSNTEGLRGACARRLPSTRRWQECIWPTAGITPGQAELLDALFSGPESLVEPPRPCSISELQTMYMRCAHLPAAWESLCAVWDVGLVRVLASRSSACRKDDLLSRYCAVVLLGNGEE